MVEFFWDEKFGENFGNSSLRVYNTYYPKLELPKKSSFLEAIW